MTPVPPQQSAERQLEEALNENARLRRMLSEAAKLLEWAAGDFDKHKISNDNWYGEYEIFRDHDLEWLRASTTLSEAKTHG